MKKATLDIISLIKEKAFLEQKLKNLLYGSIEIRERNKKKYIFVHYRESDKLITKYAGEYSDYLYRLIADNSMQAKTIKSQLRKVNKALLEAGYSDGPLDEHKSVCVDYINNHTTELIQSILAADKTPLELSEVESTLNGEIKGLSSKDVMKIINLKNALEFTNSRFIVSSKPNYTILLAINKFIEEGFIFSAGSLRTTPYTTNGRYVAPGIPVESVVKEDLEQIFVDNADPIDQAIESILYIIKSKLFLYGNKRTALVYANLILTNAGVGVMMIDPKHAEEFKNLYISYRDTENNAIKAFIKDKCIINL